MAHNIIITGSTGMVGKGVLLECLESSAVSSVLVINRCTLDIKHPKLKEIIINDFFDINSFKGELKGYNACFFCLGISAFRLTEEEYRKITYDLTLIFAKQFLKANPDSSFCYVSGEGTDSTEKGRRMWARVKGKTENDLLKLGFKSAYIFRPGFIQPMKGIKSKTKLYNTIYTILKPFYFILKLSPKLFTNSINVGKAMINILDSGSNLKILKNKDINLIAKKYNV